MFCSRCGHENPDDASFCGECGAPQVAEAPREAELYRPDISAGPTDIPARDLGDLLSETFSVYGKAIGPFFAIALIPELPNLLSVAVGGVAEVILSILSLIVGIVSVGASIICAGRVMTGQTADVALCYSHALKFVVRLFIASILIFLALAGSVILMLVVVGVPLFFYLLVVWFFTGHAIILEGFGAVDGLGRSRELVRGSWWRLFGIGVVYLLVLIALLIPGAIVAGLITSGSSAFGVVAFVIVGALLAPIISIGSTLVYIDLRVRKEGYNLEGLAADVGRGAGTEVR